MAIGAGSNLNRSNGREVGYEGLKLMMGNRLDSDKSHSKLDATCQTVELVGPKCSKLLSLSSCTEPTRLNVTFAV